MAPEVVADITVSVAELPPDGAGAAHACGFPAFPCALARRVAKAQVLRPPPSAVRKPSWPPRTAALLLLPLLAGCLDARFPGQAGTQHAEPPHFRGVVLAGTLTAGGDEARIDAIARNDGPLTYKVSSICVPPWTESMQGRLGPVYPHGPQGYCHAFGLRDFPPGESIPFTATWDGRLWDLQDERFVAAEPGAYEWTLLFELYGQCVGDACDLHDHVPLRFTVEVG